MMKNTDAGKVSQWIEIVMCIIITGILTWFIISSGLAKLVYWILSGRI